MDKLEEISFKIISGVGSAKSCYMRALEKAREGEFQKATDLIQEGEEYFLIGHRAHSELLQFEGNSEQLNFSILLIHAEDQLMSSETIKIMVEEFIQVYSIIK